MRKYLTTSNVYWNTFDFTTVKQMHYKDCELDKCSITKGDLLVCEGGDVGRAAIWDFNYDICIQNHLHRLRPKLAILCVPLYYYVFYYLKENNMIGGKGIGILGINSAERTDKKLNYNLRYISPFRDLTERYAAQAGVDPAWVYGLIRQESRFMIGARSNVGAHGLMQVMPATAREIAGKIGMSPDQLHTMDGNIRMGTWYLGDAKRRLSNDEVMATAGYNAGPSRARRWQAATPLEGAIYAETIPFNETAPLWQTSFM